MAIEIKDGIVTMTEAEYNDLYEDSIMLSCLNNAGVDNWDGRDYAIDEYNRIMGEEDE